MNIVTLKNKLLGPYSIIFFCQNKMYLQIIKYLPSIHSLIFFLQQYIKAENRKIFPNFSLKAKWRKNSMHLQI